MQIVEKKKTKNHTKKILFKKLLLNINVYNLSSNISRLLTNDHN